MKIQCYSLVSDSVKSVGLVCTDDLAHSGAFKALRGSLGARSLRTNAAKTVKWKKKD